MTGSTQNWEFGQVNVSGFVCKVSENRFKTCFMQWISLPFSKIKYPIMNFIFLTVSRLRKQKSCHKLNLTEITDEKLNLSSLRGRVQRGGEKRSLSARRKHAWSVIGELPFVLSLHTSRSPLAFSPLASLSLWTPATLTKIWAVWVSWWSYVTQTQQNTKQ